MSRSSGAKIVPYRPHEQQIPPSFPGVWSQGRGEQVFYVLNVRDRPGFLHRMMRELAGGARISLEGDLATCRFADDLVLAQDELGVLRRGTLYPRHDFVVLRLEPETIAPIFKQVLAAGLSRAIIHVQIERTGVLQLRAYDNFCAWLVATGPAVSAAVLSELKSNHVLHDFIVSRGS